MSVTSTDAGTRVQGRVCAGIDWAKDDHVVCVLGPDGAVVDRFSIGHTSAGLKQLLIRLLAAGAGEVGIERGDGPVVEALLAAGLQVFVVVPSQVKNLRARYGSAGNKDDRFDAYVLADVIRTDHRRLTPLVRSSPATVALRATVRARRDLVAHRIAVGNQLRSHLQLVFPAAAGLFSSIDTQTSLAFLERFTTQVQADWLTPARFKAWLSRSGYTGSTSAEEFHRRLVSAPRGDSSAAASTYAVITLGHVAVLRTLKAQIAALAESIADQFADHPDAPVFDSLPRSGTVRAARLLAEIGDARGLFPTADSLACLAGVAPSTRQSGKVRTVTFRWGAHRELRDAICDFAGDSRHANAWAADLYDRARARGHDHPHAVRILARAWVDIIWRCWQDGVAYDPGRHLALQRVLAHDLAA